MDREERVEKLIALTGEADETVADLYIELAEGEVMRRLYPLSEPPEEIPPKYDLLTVQIAQALYLKAGAEGQSAHSENGINRSYSTDGIPQSLLQQLVPIAEVG